MVSPCKCCRRWIAAGGLLVHWSMVSGWIATAAEPPRAVAPFDTAAARAHQEAWAIHLRTTVESTNTVGLKLMLIPPGEFLMGSSPEQLEQAKSQAEQVKMSGPDRRYLPAEAPQHRVVLTRPFRLSGTEISIGQFRRFLTETGYKTETERLGGGNTHQRTGPTEYVHDPKLSFEAPGYPVTDNSPATQITWNDAVAFCHWLSTVERIKYRLPTEAEWEYACRAGTNTQYSCGDDPAQLVDCAWYGKNSNGQSHDVGTKRPNPFGLFDMHGNTREWCADWYGANYYRQSPREDPQGPETGKGRVLRGGKWLNKESYLRSAYRFDYWPSYRSQFFGFRVVAEIAEN